MGEVALRNVVLRGKGVSDKDGGVRRGSGVIVPAVVVWYGMLRL